ncbi:MAG: hypothetical protein JNL58_02425 [Planctomyces sp.]|nr:hypothetical protein [Planctomyces sp.]
MSSTLVEQDMQAGRTDSLPVFPLPLSDFEYYMHVDDRPSHPMVFVMVVTVAGTLQRSDFQQSIDAAISANPLFRSHIRTLPGKGACWVLSQQTTWPVEWQTIQSTHGQYSAAAEEFDELLPIRAIDLTRECGIQILVQQSELKSRVVFYLHHACCDGLGGLQFIGEVFAFYSRRTTPDGGRSADFQLPDPKQLRLRERFECGAAGAERQKRSLRKSLAKAARLIFRKPVPIQAPPQTRSNQAGSSGSGSNTNAPVAIRTRVIPRSVFRALRATANGAGVSVNDLCIREMMLLIRDWNKKFGGIRNNDWIRVAVPISMRSAEHDRMPATNLVSYAFITRRVSECSDPEALAKSIHEQTGDVLYNREGIVFLKCIRVLRKLPGALRLLLGLKSCFCTVVLANVGDIRRRFSGRFPLESGQWVAGDVVVEDIWGVAPVRPNTRAAVTIGEYGGQMTVHLRTDGTVMTSADSEAFLAELVTRLTGLAETSDAH